MKYKCVVKSNSTHARIYDVESQSAMKAAEIYGRCEGGEVITVYRPRSGRPVSQVRWTQENGGEYFWSSFDPEDLASFTDDPEGA